MGIFWKIFLWPNKNLAITIPLVIIAGVIAGLMFDTAFLQNHVLLVSILMIYPLMIGLKLNQVFNLQYIKILRLSMLYNFLFVPAVAFLLGTLFLKDHPGLFAGLALISLLPTGNMTIAFTLMAKGNVPAAIQLTVVGLLSGTILAPWYLLVMVGRYVPIDLLRTMTTIGLVVFVPLLLGIVTYKILIKYYSQEHFQQIIKPKLPGVTAWGMTYIIFTSISNNAQRIVTDWGLLILGIAIVLIFYLINFTISAWLARRYYNRADAYSFVYGTAMRNLSIALGVSVTAFGPTAAFLVSLGFLFQQQLALLFYRLNERYDFLPQRP